MNGWERRNKNATDSTNFHGLVGIQICAIREIRGVLIGSYAQLFVSARIFMKYAG
jgi:hypothetical protein